MKTFSLALALVGSALAASAQAVAEPSFTNTCQDKQWSAKKLQPFCESRDLAMAVPVGQPLTIDGGTNGGISVHGWDGPNVRIRAIVQSRASTEALAQAQVKEVAIGTAGNVLRATGLGKNDYLSVSYEVFVPRQTSLVLNTLNGGISLDNLQADITFRAVNGGVSLASLGGQVRGKTENGGLNITLTGRKWEGQGLDVETTNGGIHWKMPQEYSAQLFTSTTMGSIRTGLPITKTGTFHKEVAASLGQGGATVKAVTTNGGITLEQQGRN